MTFAAVSGIAGCTIAALCSLFLLTSCASRRFRVLPAQPDYLLEDPAAHRTPFADILHTFNGYRPGGESLELLPGMELRIENAYYQPGFRRTGLNGFLGTEVAVYGMRARSLELVSVQHMPARPPADLPVDQLISTARAHHAFYRFYYEVFFRRSNTARGSVLLGAATREELARLIARLAADPDSVCTRDSANCTAFPEACSISLEMEITVNSSTRTVLWGSPLAAIVQNSRNWQLRRLYKGRLTPVAAASSDPGVLKLPLLPGDRIQTSPK